MSNFTNLEKMWTIKINSFIFLGGSEETKKSRIIIENKSYDR